MSTEKRSLDPNVVIVAVIGLVGTITAALIGVYGGRGSTPEPTAKPAIIFTDTAVPTAVPTDTVPPGEPTSTPAPPTDTPEPTFTPIPLLSAGEDWPSGCISTIWMVYPASLSVSDKDGCYINFVSGLSVRDQRLQLSIIQKPVASQEVAGMFTQIPADGIVDLNVHLRKIETGEILVGVFQKPDLAAQGAMVVIPEGDANNSAFAVYSMPADKREYLSGKFKKDSGDYLLTFDVSTGNVIVRFEKYTSTKPLDVASDDDGMKWLFIGYTLDTKKNNTLDASFFDLKVTPR